MRETPFSTAECCVPRWYSPCSNAATSLALRARRVNAPCTSIPPGRRHARLAHLSSRDTCMVCRVMFSYTKDENALTCLRPTCTDGIRDRCMKVNVVALKKHYGRTRAVDGITFEFE